MDVGARVRTGDEERNDNAHGEGCAHVCAGQDQDVLSSLHMDECRIRKRRKTLRTRPTRRRAAQLTASAAYALLASSVPSAMAQDNCISLTGSTACPAFNASSISTNSNLRGLFPFLSDVTDTASFDTGITEYISGGWAQQKYVVWRCQT